MESTQERTLNGLIELWVDIYSTEEYCVQGKAFTTRQLKPYVKAAFSEPCPSVQGFFEASPEIARACATYADLPSGLRKIILILARKEIEDKLYFFKRFFYGMAMIYIVTGMTVAETEKRLEQSFKHVLDRITLKELLNKPDESNLHTLLEALPLFPGSIAGADRRLKSVLVSRLKKVSEATTCYEQDLKVALLDCWRGKYLDKAIKMLSKQGDPTEEMSMLRRIMDGQEPQLLRTMLLRMLRETIKKWDEVRQEMRDLESRGAELLSCHDIDSMKVAPLWPQHPELSEAEGRQAIIETFSQRGIGYDDLTPKEWMEIFERHNLIRKDYEFNSKTGISISSFYGNAAHAKEQKWSRIKKKISRLSK